MSLTALRRTAAPTAVLATVATAVGLAAVPAFQADAATRPGTSIAIRTAHAIVKPGGTDRVLGGLAVRGPGKAAGRTVTLEARPKGADAFTPVGTTTARTHGGLTLKVMPATTTHYRWHYAGDTDARPSTSGVATIRVRTPQHAPQRIRTTLSIRAVHHRVLPDGSDVVKGRLRSGRIALRHRNVVLVSRAAGADGWTFEGVHRTRQHGEVAFRVMPAGATAYRLVFLGTPLLRPAHSAVVRVQDRPDVSIAADPHRITRGDSATISGVASDEGTPIAGAGVKLIGRAHGAHHAKVIASSTTAADGSVSFTVSPGRTTAYRLRLVHSTGVKASLSKVARVVVRLPSSLSIRGRDIPAGFGVSGMLRGGGHPLAHRKVTLLEQAAGSDQWTAAATAKTGHQGVVRFHESAGTGTSYRLAYAGGPRFAPSSSGTVVS